ncbi:MAG: hypothetical protein HYV26_16450, partial [Candidatus Hydrogenedentes bacterium]|nr:hypothetical protein [Candidatus Hydrogenedentota bacterium]
VSKWTGIPVGRLLEGEVEKLVKMEERLEALETLLLQQRTEARPDWAER